jgi:hypothetical protein
MQPDKELEAITEAYLTKRVYPPRIKISEKLRFHIGREFMDHIINGDFNTKRILRAIEYVAAEIESSKGLRERLKAAMEKQEKPTSEQIMSAIDSAKNTWKGLSPEERKKIMEK